MFEHSSTHSETSNLGRGITRQTFSYPTRQKRIFDILVSLLIMPILIPVIGILYLIVRFDGGPGCFGHSRIGRNGETFKCWKVRTMVTDAQERLDELLATNPVARAEWKRDRKLTNDPRVTRLGNFFGELFAPVESG